MLGQLTWQLASFLWKVMGSHWTGGSREFDLYREGVRCIGWTWLSCVHMERAVV